jgi:hypothetical protein
MLVMVETVEMVAFMVVEAVEVVDVSSEVQDYLELEAMVLQE